MKLRTRSPRDRSHGGAILETALVLPVLIAITFGAIEFGYFFWIQHTLEGAALDGCRAAIVSGSTNSDVVSQADAQLTAAGLDPGVYTITTSPANVASVAAGTNVTVTISSTWGQAGFQVLGLIASDKAISAACVMRHE